MTGVESPTACQVKTWSLLILPTDTLKAMGIGLPISRVNMKKVQVLKKPANKNEESKSHCQEIKRELL